MIGSYPTHATFAFSQLAQLGSFWSHLFFLRRHRLHALTFRKLLLWPTLPGPPPPPTTAPTAPASCLALEGRTSCCSLVAGEGPAAAELTEGGESLSGEEARARLAVCMGGEGGEWVGINDGGLADRGPDPLLGFGYNGPGMWW